jgi:hypothetical protein
MGPSLRLVISKMLAQKLCHAYDCQKPNGINEAGKITYKHETKIICEDCAKRLRNGGEYTNVTQH